MIASEIVQHYQAGAGIRALMREYHIGPHAVRRILLSMGATIRPSGRPIQAWERPLQVKEEILGRYQQGDSLVTLMAEYHIGQVPLRRLLTAMGATIRPAGGSARGRIVPKRAVEMRQRKAHDKRMASGERCQRCEILVRFDPGQDGYCGECFEEVSHDPLK